MHPQSDRMYISYDELKKHSTYSDAWISINGVVYDITRFLEKHPFGDTFRGSLGTECGGLFSSVHINTGAEALLQSETFKKKNNIVVVGQLDVTGAEPRDRDAAKFLNRIVYRSTSDDAFWLDLKSEVSAYLKSNKESIHYTLAEGALYFTYYIAIFALLSYLTWVKCSYVASTLLGFHMLCAVANISHMDTHYGFTRHRWLNFLAGHVFDLSGMSRLEWTIAHQTHHCQPHSSIDYQTNAYNNDMNVRVHRHVDRRSHHKYQHIYFWVLISMYLPVRIVATTIWLLKNNKFILHKREVAAHVLARILLFAPAAYCASVYGCGTAAALFVTYAVAYSYSAFILLYNNHADTHRVLDEHKNTSAYRGISWAQTQVRTSGNWSPTNIFLRFVEFHYGYFNYHIEHHLFPAFKPSLLRKISPIVRRVCEKHRVPYIQTTFLEVQRSCPCGRRA